MTRSPKVVFSLLSILLLSSCDGGDGGGSSESFDYSSSTSYTISSINTENNLTTVPAPTLYSNYRVSTRAETLIAATDTSGVSIGIFDLGFRTGHQELSDRTVFMHSFNDMDMNDAIEADVYDYISDSDPELPWEWADHGTAVTSVALGRNIGMAPQAQLVTSMNRNLDGAVDLSDYIQNFITPEGFCVRVITDYTNCIDFQAFHVQKMKEIATFPMPAVNFSFTSPFGNFQTGDYFFTTRYNSDFVSLHAYSFNDAYTHLRWLLSDGDLVIVNAAGNDSASLTTELVQDWSDLKATSTNPYAQTIVNVFFDPDVDTNSNGNIEDSERGITEGLLYVGALDQDGTSAWYSNYPGESEAVQARFIVAPSDVSMAWASGGRESYIVGEGTSFSTPVVTGAIALLKAAHPDKTAREIVNAILASANTAIPAYTPARHGQGLLDVEAADLYLLTN